MAKCVYCKGDVSDSRTMQICDKCGVKVWGPKMFKAILEGTETEKEKGNMELGQVGNDAIRENKFDPRAGIGFRRFQ
jgi:hypothetical protein